VLIFQVIFISFLKRICADKRFKKIMRVEAISQKTDHRKTPSEKSEPIGQYQEEKP